jgi:hypothetical protein
MAQRLGYPMLADALRETYDECLGSTVPIVLRSHEANGYTLIPASARAKWSVRVSHLARRVLRRLRRT